MRRLNILVGCEKSGQVRDAFRALGHNAVSCDVMPPDVPGPHYLGDVLDLIYLNDLSRDLSPGALIFLRENKIDRWDMAVFFPPCTYLSFVGMRWNVGNPARQEKTKKALQFVKKLLTAPIHKIALENPRGVIPRHLGVKWSQEVQPWQFGEAASKRLCLWLINLPPLRPTKIVELKEADFYVTKSGKRISKWFSNLPKDKRAELRGKTFKGIAEAMAAQWTAG